MNNRKLCHHNGACQQVVHATEHNGGSAWFFQNSASNKEHHGGNFEPRGRGAWETFAGGKSVRSFSAHPSQNGPPRSSYLRGTSLLAPSAKLLCSSGHLRPSLFLVTVLSGEDRFICLSRGHTLGETQRTMTEGPPGGYWSSEWTHLA